MSAHRAHAYCPACGGTCRDPETLARAPARPALSIRPAFTGAGSPTFKPSRKPGKFE